MRDVARASKLANDEIELVERAGRGGSAEVFRATIAGQAVALKIARADDGAARAALAREASYAALAPSPRLPELVDVGWLRRSGPHRF